jgi:polyhydroxyalkanoate synthesis regulator phasin
MYLTEEDDIKSPVTEFSDIVIRAGKLKCTADKEYLKDIVFDYSSVKKQGQKRNDLKNALEKLNRAESNMNFLFPASDEDKKAEADIERLKAEVERLKEEIGKPKKVEEL